jgi:nucleotide-binding universal stress UspA family protein
MYDRIVVALDGSELAEQVIPHVQALAAKLGSQVILLRAVTPASEYARLSALGPEPAVVTLDPVQMAEEERQEAERYLSQVAEQIRASGIGVAIETPEGSADEAIAERASADRAELIAMTTHGRSGLGHLVFGSTAESVLRKARCPVLLVRIVERDRG